MATRRTENTENTSTAGARNATAQAITSASSSTTEPRRGFEVTGTLNMGRKNGELDVRNAGETVYEDELGPEMTQYLLGKGEIVDRNKPLPPSQAEKVLAFDHLVDVARQIGALQVNGGDYQFADDETVHKGLVAFRNAVTIEQLKAAIVAKGNR